MVGLQDQAVRVRTRTGDSHDVQDELVDTQDMVAEERAVALVYNGISHAVMMATPQHLEDFALGFSLTEGIVDSAADIRAIDIENHDNGIALNMDISTACFERLKHRRRQLSGKTGCGLCGIASLDAVVPEIKPVQATVLPSFDAVNNAIQQMGEQQELQRQCGAVHAAALVSLDGKLLLLREDVGRHNALDKLLGGCAAKSAAKNASKNAENESSEHSSTFILVSSRASFEMVYKAAQQGFGSLVAVSAPTAMAIRLAKDANMNLLGFVRNQRQIIYVESAVKNNES